MAQGSPAYKGSAPFSDREQRRYKQLFQQADVDGTGKIAGLQAACFLSKSGIDRFVLKQIWDLADSAKQGWLGLEDFSVALRLVAHAQAGREISPELLPLEPAVLPHIEGAHRPQLLGGLGRGRARSPDDDGGAVPTERQLRKYARKFQDIVKDKGTPLVTMDEAQDLFSNSQLGSGDLQSIWDASDFYHDGHLSWPEFVCAMHLIRRTLEGQPPPHSAGALPPELRARLDSLQPVEVYLRQPSGSPRSTSPHDTSAFGSSQSPTPLVLGGSGGDFGLGTATASGGFSDTQADGGFDGLTSRRQGRSRKSRSSSNRPKGDDRSYSPDYSFEPERSFGQDDSRRHSKHRHHRGNDGRLQDLEAMVEADKKIIQQLRHDIDEFDREALQLEEACMQETAEMERERAECDRMRKEQQVRTQQLETSRSQFEHLKAEYKEMQFESIHLRRDHGHYGSEAVYLQNLFDEGLRDTEAVQQSIEYLEKSNQSVFAHIQSLQDSRRELQQQTQAQKDVFRREQQEVAAVRQALEKLRRGDPVDPAILGASGLVGLPDAGPPRFGGRVEPAAAAAPYPRHTWMDK